MVQKLVILGILKTNPASGYDIKKFIEKELGLFSSMETHSIYYPLKKMEQAGLIRKTELRGETHLKKYMYSITPKGEREFFGLCQEALSSEKRPFIDIDLPLYFLPYLDTKEVIARLRLRKRFLEKARQWLIAKLANNQEFPTHQKLLLKHHLSLLNTEDEFVKEILSVVKPAQP
jgi:DNA-binding PadR family transcriptional regulator